MSAFSEWWDSLWRRNDLKKSLQRELDTLKPFVEKQVDNVAATLIAEVNSGQARLLSAESLQGAIVRAIDKINAPAAVKAVLTLAVVMAAPSLSAGIAAAARGELLTLNTNIRAEAERTKKKIRGARL